MPGRARRVRRRTSLARRSGGASDGGGLRAARRAGLLPVGRRPRARDAVRAALARRAGRARAAGAGGAAAGAGAGRRDHGARRRRRPGSPSRPTRPCRLAVHLTVAGALVTVTALVHRDHRPLAWLGGLLLASATWVRLYDVGVQAPEAYTLPTAVALLLVGLHRLRRDAGRRRRPPLCCPGWRWPRCRRCCGRWSTRCRPARSSAGWSAWLCWSAAPRCAGPHPVLVGWAGRRGAGAARARAVRRSRRRSGCSSAPPASCSIGVGHHLGGAAA